MNTKIIAEIFLSLGLLGLVFAFLFLIREFFWFIHGLICEIFGRPSNDLMSALSHKFVSDNIDNIRPRVSTYSVLDGRVTKLEQIQVAQDVLNQIKLKSQLHTFRQRHFNKKWICFFQQDINEARAALKYKIKYN